MVFVDGMDEFHFPLLHKKEVLIPLADHPHHTHLRVIDHRGSRGRNMGHDATGYRITATTKA